MSAMTMMWRLESNLQKLVLSSHHMVLRVRIQTVNLGEDLAPQSNHTPCLLEGSLTDLELIN